jgi:hypothetical protein
MLSELLDTLNLLGRSHKLLEFIIINNKEPQNLGVLRDSYI